MNVLELFVNKKMSNAKSYNNADCMKMNEFKTLSKQRSLKVIRALKEITQSFY